MEEPEESASNQVKEDGRVKLIKQNNSQKYIYLYIVGWSMSLCVARATSAESYAGSIIERYQLRQNNNNNTNPKKERRYISSSSFYSGSSTSYDRSTSTYKFLHFLFLYNFFVFLIFIPFIPSCLSFVLRYITLHSLSVCVSAVLRPECSSLLH